VPRWAYSSTAAHCPPLARPPSAPPPAAHFSWSFADRWRATNHSCLLANGSAAYDRYAGAMPWDDPRSSNSSADMRNASLFIVNGTASMNK
jgi:hypothetical protein